MRYVTGVVAWEDGQLHPLETALARSPDVGIETTHQLASLDGRFMELTRFSGDLDRVETTLADSDAVVEFSLTRRTGLAVMTYRESPAMAALFGILAERSLVVVPPIEYTETHGRRGVRLTAVGPESAIAAISDDVPDGVSLFPERIGEYVPGMGGVSTWLTERQRVVFEAAVEAGYYEVPRETTHAEIAAAVGRSPATVSEQLQRIEANLLPRYLDGQSPELGP